MVRVAWVRTRHSSGRTRNDLRWSRPEHRRKRRPRRARKRQAPTFRSDNSILFRPDDVAHRRQFGQGRRICLLRQTFGPNTLTALVERVSRCTVLRPKADRRTRPIMAKLVAVLGSLPFKARSSITFDRGSAVIDRSHRQAGPGFRPDLATRARQGRKGTVETTTRRMRRGLPRDIDPTTISGSQLKAICDRLNATPRKGLGWRTPAAVVREKVLDRRA